MQRLYIFLLIICVGCNTAERRRVEKLRDTLVQLRLKADFKPLDSTEAYSFMNKYFLPGLDSFPTKRKIFMYALAGTDFNAIYKYDENQLVAEFLRDTTDGSKPIVVLMPPPPKLLDECHKWDSNKLNAEIIADSALLNADNGHRPSWDMKFISAWRKKYGEGYICVSYPQYNANTKRMVISEWLENSSMCGNGRDAKQWYVKTGTGWKLTSADKFSY